MAESTVGLFPKMIAALGNTVAAHAKVKDDLNAHGEEQAQRLAQLREQRAAHVQMTNLTGKVEY